jgi:hypothetical protein
MEEPAAEMLPGWGAVGRDEEGLDPIRPHREGLPAHSQQARAEDALSGAISVHKKSRVRTVERKSGCFQDLMRPFLVAGLGDRAAAREEVEGAPNMIAFMGRPPE